MKLKKISCFLQTDIKEKGLRRTIIRSGFKESYLVIEEDYAYNLGVSYLSIGLEEFLAAKKSL